MFRSHYRIKNESNRVHLIHWVISFFIVFNPKRVDGDSYSSHLSAFVSNTDGFTHHKTAHTHTHTHFLSISTQQKSFNAQVITVVLIHVFVRMKGAGHFYSRRKWLFASNHTDCTRMLFLLSLASDSNTSNFFFAWGAVCRSQISRACAVLMDSALLGPRRCTRTLHLLQQLIFLPPFTERLRAWLMVWGEGSGNDEEYPFKRLRSRCSECIDWSSFGNRPHYFSWPWGEPEKAERWARGRRYGTQPYTLARVTHTNTHSNAISLLYWHGAFPIFSALPVNI